MGFEWNRDKAKANLSKHDVSFDEAKTVFDDPLFVDFYDPDHSDDEERYIIVGQSQKNRLLIVSYTERKDKIRLISAREAPRMEKMLMKKIKDEMEDELRPEYDLRSLRVRRIGDKRTAFSGQIIQLAPDVVELFPNSESVNEALRFLIRVTRGSTTSTENIGVGS